MPAWAGRRAAVWILALLCLAGSSVRSEEELAATERRGERWTVSLLAGSGAEGDSDGNATAASFSFTNPDVAQWLVGASFSNDDRFILISDQYNHRVRAIEASNGQVTTWAVPGPPLDKQSNPNTAHRNLQASAVLGGYAYFTDSWNPANPGTLKPSIAKFSIGATTGSLMERMPGAIRNLTIPTGMFFGPIGITAAGGKVIFSNSYASIASLDPTTFEVEHIAGPLSSSTGGYRDAQGTFAQFGNPMGLAASRDGAKIYIVDSQTCNIRVLTLATKYVSTLVGPTENDVYGQVQCGYQDGTGTSVRFKKPTSIASLADGERLVVVDSGNNALRIIDIANRTVSTLAGNANAALGGYVDGEGTSVQFNFPSGIASDRYSERLVVTDARNNRVRLVQKSCATFYVLKNGRCLPCASNPCPLGYYRGICKESETDAECLKCPKELPEYASWKPRTQNCSFECNAGTTPNATHCIQSAESAVDWFTNEALLAVVIVACVLVCCCASLGLWWTCKPPSPITEEQEIVFGWEQKEEEAAVTVSEFGSYKEKFEPQRSKSLRSSASLAVARSIKSMRMPSIRQPANDAIAAPAEPHWQEIHGADLDMEDTMLELGLDPVSMNRFGAPAPIPVPSAFQLQKEAREEERRRIEKAREHQKRAEEARRKMSQRSSLTNIFSSVRNLFSEGSRRESLSNETVLRDDLKS